MNTCIFDLDGTLLPMPNQELFLDSYFNALAAKFVPYGHNPKELIKAVWVGTKAMIENDGTMTNEQKFWQTFTSITNISQEEIDLILSEENFEKEFELIITK